MRYGVFTLDGHYAVDKTIPVEIVENTSRCIATFNVEVWNETGIDHSAAFAALSDNGKLISRNRMFMPRLGELKWHKPDVKISRAGKWAVFSSAVFVWGVCLDLDGEKYLPDNNFDVWPGMKYQIPWQDDCPLPEILHMGNLVH